MFHFFQGKATGIPSPQRLFEKVYLNICKHLHVEQRLEGTSSGLAEIGKSVGHSLRFIQVREQCCQLTH